MLVGNQTAVLAHLDNSNMLTHPRFFITPFIRRVSQIENVSLSPKSYLQNKSYLFLTSQENKQFIFIT